MVEGIRAQYAKSVEAAESISRRAASRCSPTRKPAARSPQALRAGGRHFGQAEHRHGAFTTAGVVALGPGFTAGADCHAWVDHARPRPGPRDHERLRPPEHRHPREIGGHTVDRLLARPRTGYSTSRCHRDLCRRATWWRPLGRPVVALISGVVRGLLREGTPVHTGNEDAHIDPRCEVAHCFSVSDKARAIGGAYWRPF